MMDMDTCTLVYVPALQGLARTTVGRSHKVHHRSTNPLHTSEGDFTANVNPGTDELAQGTTKIHVATAGPMDGRTQATKVDIREELADKCKNTPLYERGFVSPPTTATATRQDEHEQHTQVSIGNCAGTSDYCQGFPGPRPRLLQTRRLAPGTHQTQATHCSEHDAQDNVANNGPPQTTGTAESMTTDDNSLFATAAASTPTCHDKDNKASTMQVGKRRAENAYERGCGSSPVSYTHLTLPTKRIV